MDGTPAAPGRDGPDGPRALGTSRSRGGFATALPRRRRAHIAALALAALAACHPYVEGNGVYYEETRPVGPFVGVHVEDGIQATVTVGTPQSVVVSGDSNIVKSIQTVVVPFDGMQVLKVFVTLDTFTRTFPLGLKVTVPDLRYLSAIKVSRIEGKNASTAGTTPFRVVASNGSTVTLAGAGGSALDVDLTVGTDVETKLDASGYPVANADVTLTGKAHAMIDAAVAVTGTADATSVVENFGAGACNVVLTGTTTPASCAPR